MNAAMQAASEQRELDAIRKGGYRDPMADPERKARVAAANEAGMRRTALIEQYEYARAAVKGDPSDANIETFRVAVAALAAIGVDPALASGMPHDLLATLPMAHRLQWLTRASSNV